MHRLEHLRNLLRQSDAEGFANELNLDPARTRQWFDQGFTHEGYGAEVIKALGTRVMETLTTTRDGGDQHG